jgi:hypothetical protein
MSGEIIGTPNSPPTEDADWQKAINNYLIGGKGQNNITLTNWSSGNTSEPAIAAGSTIEVNGSFVIFEEEESIDFSSVSDGIVYILIDVTSVAGEASAVGTNTVPTWDAEKSGFYIDGNRFSGFRVTLSSGSYNNKSRVLTNTLEGIDNWLLADGGLDTNTLTVDDDIYTAGDTNINGKLLTGELIYSGTPTITVITIEPDDEPIIPKGTYIASYAFMYTYLEDTLGVDDDYMGDVEQYFGSTVGWIPVFNNNEEGYHLIFSDGTDCKGSTYGTTTTETHYLALIKIG